MFWLRVLEIYSRRCQDECYQIPRLSKSILKQSSKSFIYYIYIFVAYIYFVLVCYFKNMTIVRSFSNFGKSPKRKKDNNVTEVNPPKRSQIVEYEFEFLNHIKWFVFIFHLCCFYIYILCINTFTIKISWILSYQFFVDLFICEHLLNFAPIKLLIINFLLDFPFANHMLDFPKCQNLLGFPLLPNVQQTLIYLDFIQCQISSQL